MNPTSETKNSVESKSAEQLKAILFLLQTNLEGVLNEVERSDALLAIGEKTALSLQIENNLNNPMKAIFDLSSNIDRQVKNIVDKLVKGFLIEKANFIQSAFLTKTAMNDLHYAIVLKSDTTENREQIFSFLDEYSSYEISHRYPVFFQFVPAELIAQVYVKEGIKLS